MTTAPTRRERTVLAQLADLPLRRVHRLSDAVGATCRDCDREFWDDSPYWDLSTVLAMHSHKQPDGTWQKSGGRKRAILYGIAR